MCERHIHGIIYHYTCNNLSIYYRFICICAIHYSITTGDSPYKGTEQLRGYYDDTIAKLPNKYVYSQYQANRLGVYMILICGSKMAFYCMDKTLWNRGMKFLSKYSSGLQGGMLCMRLGDKGIEVIPQRECFNSPSKWYDVTWDNHHVPVTALARYIGLTCLPPVTSSVNPNILLQMAVNPRTKGWVEVCTQSDGVVLGVNFKGELCRKP